MKVEMKGFGNIPKIKVGDILVYRDVLDGFKYYLITCKKGMTGALNDKDSYVLQNLDGNNVWRIEGNSKNEITKMVEGGKFTHYSQDDFKLTLTKID